MPGYPVNDKHEATTDMWRISQHCFADDIRAEMTLADKVQLCDITLREGRQLPGVSLTRDQVIMIADKLAEAGVSMVQMHHDDPQEMAEVKKRHPHMLIDALVHPTAVLRKCRRRSPDGSCLGAALRPQGGGRGTSRLVFQPTFKRVRQWRARTSGCQRCAERPAQSRAATRGLARGGLALDWEGILRPC